MIVTKKRLDFNSFEQKVFAACCAAGCEAIKAQLEGWDRELAAMRDRSVYRHKGRRKTVLKTVMGEVEYERTVYEQKKEDGTKSFVYLLDKAIGKNGSGFMSGMLSAQIAEAACAGTYRRTAQSVSEMTGQAISHTAAWNVVQELGGGICQVSSTLYYSTLLANLKIDNRVCHYFGVSYLPTGLDATVSWKSPDFKFTNNREYPVKLETEVNTGNNTLTVRILGTDVDGSYVKMTYASWLVYNNAKYPDVATGYKAATYRWVYDKDGNATIVLPFSDSTEQSGN